MLDHGLMSLAGIGRAEARGLDGCRGGGFRRRWLTCDQQDGNEICVSFSLGLSGSLLCLWIMAWLVDIIKGACPFQDMRHSALCWFVLTLYLVLACK